MKQTNIITLLTIIKKDVIIHNMRNILIFFIVILLFSCDKNINENNDGQRIKEIYDTVSETINENEFELSVMYVDSPEGLRVRNEPNIDGEKIFLLPHRGVVKVVEIDNNTVSIDGINGNWYLIKYNEINGWVFSGYLTDDIDKTYADLQLQSHNIIINNCLITKKYTVPKIRNRIMGIEDDFQPHLIETNNILQIYDGLQIQLTNEIDLKNKISITLRNSQYEFSKNLNLNIIRGYDNDSNIQGYYENVYLENKFWIDDENNWIAEIKLNDSIILQKEIEAFVINQLFSREIHDDIFVEDAIYSAKVNEDYIFRCKKSETELIIIYYSQDWEEYIPLLYLIPQKSENGIIDVNIKWNTNAKKGIYYISTYKINNLPIEELYFPIFNYIEIK
jgi:hypothetical protein